jgi:hypothetical protein
VLATKQRAAAAGEMSAGKGRWRGGGRRRRAEPGVGATTGGTAEGAVVGISHEEGSDAFGGKEEKRNEPVRV